MVTPTAVFISLRTFYVSRTPSTSGATGFAGLHLLVWPNDRVLVCENTFKDAVFEDMIVGISHASPAGSRGLDGNVVEFAESPRRFDGVMYLIAGEPDFPPCGGYDLAAIVGVVLFPYAAERFGGRGCCATVLGGIGSGSCRGSCCVVRSDLDETV